MLTINEKRQIVLKAINTILSHKDDAFAVVSTGGEKNTLDLLIGNKLPITKFRFTYKTNSNEVMFDESDFKWNIIFNKEKKGKTPWYVITDINNNYIASSYDTDFFLCMTIIAYSKDETDNIPYGIKVCFDNRGQYPVTIVASAKDMSISALWYYEITGLPKSLQNSDNNVVLKNSKLELEEDKNEEVY